MPKAFLITPFSPESAGNENPQLFATVQAAVNEATKLAGVDLVHPAQIKASGVIVEDVKKEIREADVVIAILTGQNPNVFYELGIALETAARPAILIVGSDDDVPFDVRPHRYLTYNSSGQLVCLPATLAEAIRATLARPPTTLQIAVEAQIRFHANGLSLHHGDAKAANDPLLPFFDLPDVFDAFKLLSWRVRLTSYVGYQEELASLIDWATSDKKETAVRLITGQGGSGKSRLAAELALELRNRRYSAGFLNLGIEEVIRVREKGLVGIIDYPEQFLPQILQLLRSIKSANLADLPIRLLLLSRFPADYWREKFDAIQASYIVDSQQTNLKRLTLDQSLDIYQEAVRALGIKYLGKEVENSEHEVISWLNRDPDLNCRPLFSLAAALHTVDEPEEKLSLTGRDTLRQVARRERIRLEPYGQVLGFEKHGLGRLIALGALRGDLDLTVVKNLNKPYLKLNWPEQSRLPKIISEMPQWDERHSLLRAPQPDLLAAAFLEQILDDAPQDVRAEWAWVAIRDLLLADPERRSLITRLERIAQDIALLYEHSDTALSATLVDMSARRYEKVSKVPELYEDWIVEVDTFQASAEMARIAWHFLSQLSSGEPLRVAERLLKQADLYELDRGLLLKIHLPAWPIWILNRRISRGEKVYYARRRLAGLQLLSGDFRGAAATAAATLAQYKESAAPHSEYKKQFELRDGYLFAAACMAEAGDTRESLKWIEEAFANPEQFVFYFATPDGVLDLQRMFFRLYVRLHRSRLRRSQSPVPNSDPELTRCLQNIFRSFNRLYSAGLRLFGDGTRLNIITTNLFLALEALLGPGIIPARGKETTITMLNLSRSSARGLSLTTLQLPSLALTLAELSVILSGRADEQRTVLIQILELFEHILSSTKDPGFSEISEEVRADLTGLRSSQNPSGCLAEMRAKCKLPDDAVRSSIWNVGCIMTFVLSNFLFDTKGSIY
jgi:hypothetical protein